MAKKRSITKDIIYQGNSIISIETLPGYSHPVIVKKPAQKHPSPHHIRSLEKEYEMTRALGKVKGVRKALDQKSIDNQPVLILEYIDGEILQDYIGKKKLNLRSKLKIAVDLARILSEIHQQNIIHLDLNSNNILIGNKPRKVHFIDLGSASRLDIHSQQKVRPDQMLGTLPYISPEQTGRINRAVDERSDLYSLGVVLYELMTGQLPFDSKDPLDLVHQHIAGIPVSPSELSPKIPKVISAIILKLLRKNAEDRYQSAAGVQADLGKCLQRMDQEDTIEKFPLGENDYSSRLRFPQKLYGRESELKELERAFDSACSETSSIMFISGYSGIGKTALVEEIQRPVSQKGGYFIAGKFDQYLRTTPYTVINQAFAAFVSLVLAEPETKYREWQAKVQLAVGDLGKVLTDIAPALEELLGPQPDVPELGDHETENRLNFVFINFLLTVATDQHPLVLFIDDLQWIDAVSLRLLEVIRSDFNQPGLLLICAYRDNEVDASHPLMGIIDHQEETGLPIRVLNLDDLQPRYIDEILSDILKSREGVKNLGTTVYAKTHGNPFFVRRFLLSLNEEGRIHYDAEIRSWKWDVGNMTAGGIADNVADLLANSITQLPEETQSILMLAACMGNRFDSAVLALASALDEQEVIKRLDVALRGRYIFTSGGRYQFVHDQVQQAAYALIAEEERPRMHLKIGRSLFSRAGRDELEEALFDIVHHFNAGAPLLDSESEKVTVAELDLKAARKARSATAYAEGFAYIVQGLALLDTNSWQHHYDLTLAMHNEAAELSYLTGHYDILDEFEGHIHKNARSILDRTHVHYIRTMLDTDQGRLLESIETGISALAELGITVPREPSPEDIERAEAAFTEALATRSMEELAHLPEMTDRGALAAMEIMAAVLLNAYIASPQHLSLLTHRGASLSLQHGNGPWSPFFYSSVVVLWGGAVDISPTAESAQALEAAHTLAKILLRLLENPRYARCRAKSLEGMLGSLNWHTPMRQLLDQSLAIYQAGLDTGDLLFAGLGIFHLANFGVASGMNLIEYIKTISAYRQIVKDLGQDFAYRMTGIWLQTVQNLMTPSSEPDVLEEQHFNEHQWLSDAVAANDGLTLFLVFQAKLLLSYHFDRDDRLMEYAAEAEKYLDSVYAMINIGFFRFYDSLSRLRLYPRLSTNERKLALKRVESNQMRMRIWARSSPMTFLNKFDLVAAEIARVSGNIGPAMENYERAIVGARDNKFIHEEALANELYACFWQERGNDKIAEIYMREAHALYQQWGAGAKVIHLEKRYPQWFQTQTTPVGEPDAADSDGNVQTTVTRPITSIQMDLDSILDASKTLSSETDLDQLKAKMLKLVMTQSGATTAFLLLKQEDNWFVQARSDTETVQGNTHINEPYDPAIEDGVIPTFVFNYCMRTKELVVVEDAHKDGRFKGDGIAQARDIRSMACIPVLTKREVKAMIYLENRQLADVFNPERIEVLKHLSAQFGISMENALLYDDLKQKTREAKESESRFRSVVENANETIVVTQNDLVKYSNPMVEELTGYSKEEMATLGFSKFIHPDDLNIVLSEYQARISGEKLANKYTIRIITKQGQIKYIFVNSALIEWNGEPATLAMLTDITKQELAREELQQSESYFRSLNEQSPLAIVIYNPTGKIIQYNTAWKNQWGFNDEEANLVKSSFNILSDEQAENKGIMPLIKRCFKGEQVILPPIEYDVKQSAAEIGLHELKEKKVWIQCHLTPIWNKKHELAFVVNTLVDLTDLKEYELQLQISRNEYKTLIENIPDVAWTISREGKTIFISSNIQDIYGYSPEDIYKRPIKLWLERIHPEDIDDVKSAFRALFETGSRYDIEYRIKKKNGEWIWLYDRSIATNQKDGLAYAHGIFTDVTKRKQVENKLYLNERRLSRIFETVAEILYYIRVEPDECFRFISVNAAFLESTGLTENQIVGKRIEEVIPETSLQLVLDNYKKSIKENGIVRWEEISPYPAGTKTGVVSIAPVLNEKGICTHLVGSVHDITERKRAEKKLKEQEAFYRTISEYAPVMIDSFDDNGRCVIWNRECEKVFGWTEEEIFAHEKPLELFYPDPEIRMHVLKTVSTKPDGEFREWRPKSKDGKELICLWANFKLPAGKIINLGYNITEQKNVEEEAQKQKEMLARIGRTSSMGQLTGSIAHELSQPLTGILSNAQAAELMLNNDRWESGEMKDILGEIIADTKRCGDVMRNLRDLYREQKGKFDPVDINTVVDETIQLLHSEFIFKHIIVAKECAPTIPKINGNTIQLQQVLVNLIINGIQAMSDLAREDRHLLIRTAFDKNNMKAWVEDRGSGIPADKIDRIFEPLATWKPGGTGMGLAISNAIIKSHGGKMWAENKPDGGARVGFILPVLKKGQK